MEFQRFLRTNSSTTFNTHSVLLIGYYLRCLLSIINASKVIIIKGKGERVRVRKD